MKKLFLFFAILLVAGIFSSMAQISQGGLPKSFKSALNTDVDRVELQPMNLKNVLAEEDKYPKDGRIPHIGYSINTDISPSNSGTWTELPEGGRLWQLQIKSPSALALGIYYDNFRLPVGSTLFLYNEDKTQLIGSFTWENNDNSGLFANEMIYGDIVNIEYYEPERVLSKLALHINEVAYFYRGVENRKNPTWTEPSEACEVNINCTPVGTNWQDKKKGVARILVKVGASYGYCTGSLVNNTSQNCTPYFLSAWHCYEGASAADLNQWVFYFNYEASACTTPTTEPTSNSMTGATLKATAPMSGGSDMLLLQLNQTVPTSYNPFMNGWNRTNTASASGASIHHPAGSIKKISTYSAALTSATPNIGGNTTAANAEWRVVWSSNSNGWGVTEGGSSGSPIFDASGLVVGTLSGGGSYCTAQSSPDYYGKMYYHWDQNAGGTTTQVKTWLDPTTSGVTTLVGKNCGAPTTPVAAFTGTPTTVAVGGPVTFTSQSTGSPTTYSWNFGSGATPATATTVGPHTVTYSTVGLKTVSLTVGTPTNTLTKTNYITVSNNVVSTCDTLYAASFTSGTCNMTIYYCDATPFDSGFVSGQNAYLDKEKAMLYTGTTGGTISDVFVMYGLKKGTTGNTSVKIYSSTAGAPGSQIGATSAIIIKNAIDTTNQGVNFNNKYHFSSPITVGTDFFVSVVLPTGFNNTTNQLAIWSSQYTCSSTSSLAYEMGSDNSWSSFTSMYGTNIDLAIFPIVCSPTTSLSEIATSSVSLFPNPAGNEIFIYLPYPSGEKVDVNIMDIYGKLCKKIVLSSNPDSPSRIDISDLSNGIYLLNGESLSGKFARKISVIK